MILWVLVLCFRYQEEIQLTHHLQMDMPTMILGYAAILTTLLLWSGFFISLKGGAISSLQPARFAIHCIIGRI